MKRIIKGAEPQAFTDWKALASDDWQPRYGDLRDPEKRELHEALLMEQGQVCCYCGRSVTRMDSHVEHFRPQESYEGLSLSYENLHASCIRETKPGMPLHCGHAKGSAFVERTVISPLDLDCEHRFIYPSDGTIAPTNREDDSAMYMIQLLCLDLPYLRDRRAEALRRIFDTAFMETMHRSELETLLRAYSMPDTSGSVMDFGHVIARHAERLLEFVP
jgi:uncharacterized protein (TIGR02646 family)